MVNGYELVVSLVVLLLIFFLLIDFRLYNLVGLLGVYVHSGLS